MKRLERLTAMLTFLQSRSHSPLEDLMKKFPVSERTIFRDIRSLQESGVPISFEKGRGYFIVGGYFLPPLSFSLEETRSLFFAGQLVRKYTDPKTNKYYMAALDKIRNKMKIYQRSYLEELEKSICTYIDESYTDVHNYLSMVEKACSEKMTLSITYQSLKGERTKRLVEPIGLTFYSQSWHMIGYCHLRDDYRDFVLSRIQSLQFSREKSGLQHITLDEYIQRLQRD